MNPKDLEDEPNGSWQFQRKGARLSGTESKTQRYECGLMPGTDTVCVFGRLSALADSNMKTSMMSIGARIRNGKRLPRQEINGEVVPCDWRMVGLRSHVIRSWVPILQWPDVDVRNLCNSRGERARMTGIWKIFRRLRRLQHLTQDLQTQISNV